MVNYKEAEPDYKVRPSPDQIPESTPITPSSPVNPDYDTTYPTTPTLFEDNPHIFEELQEYLDEALLNAVTSSNTALNAAQQSGNRLLRGLDPNNILPDRQA